MTCQEIITKLKSKADVKYKANVVRMGIPEEYSIGVSTAMVRKIAKEIENSNELAYELWKTSYHEARLLAVLLFEKDKLSIEDVEGLMNEVISWDLCDHLCKNLIIKQVYYNDLIIKWVESSRTYKKRAAFTLMASSLIHDKNISDDRLDNYLDLIHEKSQDNHQHIKRAISWALREIGKKDFKYNEKALLLAHDLKDNGTKIQAWIAKDAIKELENIVKVDERKRLISRQSKMGRKI
ncbi:DNA alkylation repair protein [Microaceticoccus formicicus]|uniref:DNA alkylation repair protein n=1 Tax=Microaceticoccus formicicus TaxID=3118105 RepID=UPI003CD0326B|nr:DNA alkylation repair protein [Peptoniphilaceae bacterium AMB_02]